MTRTDRILLVAMLALIMLRMAIVSPLNDWRGALLAFGFAAAGVVFALRKGVQP